MAARAVVGRDRGGLRARPRLGRHEGRRSSPRCTRSPSCARASAPRSCCRRSPRRRTAGSARSPRSSATPPSTPCLIPEPTGFEVVCAQAGALTFRATVRGRAAHAADAARGPLRARPLRRAPPRDPGPRARAQPRRRAPGDAARSRCPIRSASAAIEGGEWSSAVPDRRRVRGPARRAARARPRRGARGVRGRVLDDGEAPPVEVEWTGGQFAPGATPPDDPWVAAVARRGAAPSSAAPRGSAGVPYGADMRQFCARGIPAVMVGTPRARARARGRRAGSVRRGGAGADHRAGSATVNAGH